MEVSEVFFDYRLVNRYSSKIGMVSDFVYLWTSCLRGNPTLGEEYCEICPYDPSTKKFPSIPKRILYVFGSILGPYYVSKGIKMMERPIVNYAEKIHVEVGEKPTFKSLFISELLKLLPPSLSSFFKTFEHLHLGLFFIWKNYYEFIKRILNIKYRYIGPQTES